MYHSSDAIQEAIARRPRALGAQLLTVCSLCSWANEASAAPPANPVVPAERETYGMTLGLAYLLAPALAAAAGAGVFEVTESDPVAIAAGGLMFTLPAATHAYKGAPDQALISFGSMLGVTLLGAAVFGGLGYVLGSAGCEETEAEGCGVPIFAFTAIGAGVGASAGYIGYAIYDVVNNASVPALTGADEHSEQALHLWLNPVTGRPQERGRSVQLTGVQLGVTLGF